MYSQPMIAEPADVASNRRKDLFLAMVGHELRTPLASIHNAIRALGLQSGEASGRSRSLALIERQVRKMTRLVDDLSDVSRIAHGRLRLNCERLDLRAIVRDAIETLESDISERRHTLTTAMPEKPVWVQADPSRLEQVFVNLLANAAKYTNAGGDLSVWMHITHGEVVVRVRDSGIGIAHDALPQVFELFARADEATVHSKSGLGLGLALVRDIVQLHGGSVTAGSAGPGRGSEFAVRLPREAAQTAL